MVSLLFWIVFIAVAVILIKKMILIERKRLDQRIEESKLIASQMGFTFNMNW